MAMLFFILFGAEERDAVITQFLEGHTSFLREKIFVTTVPSPQGHSSENTVPIEFTLRALAIDGTVTAGLNPKSFNIPSSFVQPTDDMRLEPIRVTALPPNLPSTYSERMALLRINQLCLSATLEKDMDDGRRLSATYKTAWIPSQPKFMLLAYNDELIEKETKVFAALTVLSQENLRHFFNCFCFVPYETLHTTTTELDGHMQFKDDRLYKKVVAHYFENDLVKKWTNDIRDHIGFRHLATWYEPQNPLDAVFSCPYGNHLTNGIYKHLEDVPRNNFAGLHSDGNGRFSIAKQNIKIFQKIDTERMFLTHSMPDRLVQRQNPRPLFETINGTVEFERIEYGVAIFEKIPAIQCKFDDDVIINAILSLAPSGYPHEGFYTYDLDEYVLTKVDEPGMQYKFARHDDREPSYSLPIPQRDAGSDPNITPRQRKQEEEQAYRNYLDLVSYTALLRKIDLRTIPSKIPCELQTSILRMQNLVDLSVCIGSSEITDFVIDVLPSLTNLRILKLDSTDGTIERVSDPTFNPRPNGGYAGSREAIVEKIGSTLAKIKLTKLTIRRPFVNYTWVTLPADRSSGFLAVVSGIGALTSTIYHTARFAAGVSFEAYIVFAREIGRSTTLRDVTFLGLERDYDKTNMGKAFSEGANERPVTVMGKVFNEGVNGLPVNVNFE